MSDEEEKNENQKPKKSLSDPDFVQMFDVTPGEKEEKITSMLIGGEYKAYVFAAVNNEGRILIYFNGGLVAALGLAETAKVEIMEQICKKDEEGG